MAVRGQDITSVIRRQIQEFGGEVTMVDMGTVVEVGDGIARVPGSGGMPIYGASPVARGYYGHRPEP